VSDAFNILHIPSRFQSDIVELLVNNEHVIKTSSGQDEYLQISAAGETFLQSSSYMEGWKEEMLAESKGVRKDWSRLEFMSTKSILIIVLIVIIVLIMITMSK